MKFLEAKNIKGILGVIHMIGIGGIGMSGIAEILHNLGYKTQGSDIGENSNTLRLKKQGIQIFKGHSSSNIEGCEFVVTSSAIKETNPEVIAAKERNIPVIQRAEMLAELMKLKTSIAISGTHGKTTTTSLVTTMFEAAGQHPTVINGGILNNRSTNAYLGQGDFLIAEADESDATFIKIPSTIAVITNIDAEHMEFYKNFDNLKNSFEQFITNLPFYGFAVVCIDHPVVRSIADKITDRKVITYGVDSEDADIYASNIRFEGNDSIFDVKIKLPFSEKEQHFKDVKLSTLGRHNVQNSLAAIAIAAELDFGDDVLQNGLNNFHGVKRRFTRVGDFNGALVIDDYAHHPAEIVATLQTACSLAKQRNGKVVAIFQPHKYSRLENLFSDFLHCFDEADEIYISEVFAAGEEIREDVSHKTLVAAIKKQKIHPQIETLESTTQIKQIANKLNNNDIFLFMGAGTITKWPYELIANKEKTGA